MPGSTVRFARRLPAVPVSVPRLRGELSDWLRQVGVGGEHAQRVRLAVNEVLTNAVIHGFVGLAPGTVSVVAEAVGHGLEVRVVDDGVGIGPRPDSPGLGMGVPVVGKLCTSVDFRAGPGGQGTEVQMRFALTGPSAEDGLTPEAAVRRVAAPAVVPARRPLGGDVEVADIVDGLAAAVTIQRPGEGFVYANQAAAEAMGLASPQQLLDATPEQIDSDWVTFDEDGEPVVADRWPSRQLLTGARSAEPLTIRTINRRTGREYWRTVRTRGVFDEGGTLTLTVTMIEDITQMRRAVLTQRLLADAGEVLSSSRDYDQTLVALAGLTVPELADWCAIVMPDDHGLIRQVAVAHADPEKVRFAREYGARYPARIDSDSASAAILRGGPAVLLPEIPDTTLRQAVPDSEQRAALATIGMRSAIQVPIAATGEAAIGVLTLVQADSARVFGEADRELAMELGRRAGTAIQSARLHDERARIAATLQASLLPDELPDVPGFASACRYRAAGAENWVGGDFYDVFAVREGWMVIVGDVAGHGAEAAALTAQARHTLRAIGEAFGDPVQALAHLNDLLLPRGDPSLCTACAVMLQVADDGQATAAVTCAGHPLPYLLRYGEVSQVGRAGPLLGAWESTFEEVEFPLLDRDILVLYTDGVLDARDGAERFGEERLRGALAGAEGAADAVERVQDALDAFQTGEQADDTAILAIQRPAPDALADATQRKVNRHSGRVEQVK